MTAIHVEIEGWRLARLAGPEDEPRMLDTDLAEQLGYERPRDIRKLIRRMLEEGKIAGVHVRATVARTSMPRGGEREETVEEYWLTEEQALLVTTQSETPHAWERTKMLVRVFRLAVRGELPSAGGDPAAALRLLVNDAITRGALGSAAAFLNAARGVQKVTLGIAKTTIPAPAAKPSKVTTKRARLAEARAMILDALRAHPAGLTGRGGLYQHVPIKHGTLWEAVGELVQEQRIHRREEQTSEGGHRRRVLYVLAGQLPLPTGGAP